MHEVNSVDKRAAGGSGPGVSYPVGGFPLTPLQSGMLFHQILAQGRERGVDLEQLVCRTSEKIDPEAFSTAVQALVSGYPILRTRFEWKSGREPFQEVVPGVEASFVVDDRSSVPAAVREEDHLRELARDREQGLDLGEAPLLRARLIQYDGDDTRLLLTIHHAIVDGRCFPVLLDDLFRLYDAAAAGSPLPAVRGSMDFREFVEWIHSQPLATRSREYWTGLLQGFSAPTPLIVDSLPDCPSGDLSWQEQLVISKDLTTQLEGLAGAVGVTMNTVVQAAWAVLLAKYSGDGQVVFGGTRACRRSSLPAVQDAIGLFINTLPVRAQVESRKPLRQLLRELRAQWVAMREHEHTPLGRIQAWSDVEKGQPLFHSILVFENFDLGELMRARGGGWEQRQVDLYEQTNYPLTVAAYRGESLRIKIEFAPERFSAETIRRMLGHIRELLRQFAENASGTIGSFHLVTADEARALWHDWASPRAFSVPGTLTAWFESQVDKSPGATALCFEGREWTYESLNREANRVAHALITGEGVERGQIIGLCVERSPEIVIGILGILKAGAAYLPIDLAYPGARLQWMLEDSGAPVLLTQEALLDRIPETAAKTVTFENIESHEVSAQNPDVPSDPADLAYVIFTSGSTGKPKGCQLTHANVARLFTATEAWFGFGKEDVWTLFHSFAFDFSVWEIWGALLYGGRVVVVPYDTTRSPEDFYELLVREEVTILNQTPSAFRQLIEAERKLEVAEDRLSLREVIFGGEALELESLRSWFERHGDRIPRLVNMYGITETTVHVTFRPICKDDLFSGSVIGRPIPDLEIHLLSPEGHPVPLGVPGEIHVGGAGVAMGYLNRPELTAERFLPHPRRSGQTLYRTGDVARFLPGGDLEYLGRCDDQVKIRGFRIELGEIQSVLARHDAVREAFVAVTGEGQARRIVAYLVGERAAADLTGLRAHAGKFLPPYMIPAAFIFLEKFPLTNNGKIDRKALPAPGDQIRSLSSKVYQPPQGETEALLGAIWSKALALDRVGRDENYFELGGDSILSIQIVSQARREGFDLNPRDLFDHQTIAELAEAAGQRGGASRVEAALVADSGPLTPIQRWFFAHDLPNPNHWNQAFLFEMSGTPDPVRLEAALLGVVERHPALRTRFSGEKQEVVSAAIRFRHLPGQVGEAGLGSICLEAQQAPDISEGVLLSAVSFEHGGAPRLFVAVHHLGIDGVSWRVFMEDLEALYTGRDPDPATTPFLNWAHHLERHAGTEAVLAQRSYWEKAAVPFSLPDQQEGSNTVAASESIVVRLGREETVSLLSETPMALRSQIDEILLAALVSALSSWTGADTVCLDTEGHGREEQEGFDLSRSIGWFTTIYPVTVQVAGESSLPNLVAAAKNALRAVPDKGLGCGLLDPEMPPREVLFNYLGRFDQVTGESELFKFAPEDPGSWYDGQSARAHLLEINAWVKEGCLEFKWTFAKLARTPVAAAAEHCLGALRSLLAASAEAAREAWVPSDFPMARLGPNDLARLEGPVEDVLALTPLQQLYFTLETARGGSGIDQWHWRLAGEVDAEILRQAWQSAIDHHPGLRTEFHGEGLTAPVQIVRPRCAVTLEELVLEEGSDFDGVLQDDLEKGLPIQSAPLMRLTLVRLAEGETRLIWTHHHLQVDGWSWPVLLSHVSRAYRSFADGRAFQAPAAKSVRDVLRWSDGRETAASERFWRAQLAGFTRPTPLASPTKKASHSFGESSFTLGKEAASSLEALARRLACPPNALVQAAWALVLGQRSGHDEVIFGASFSGRPADLPGVEGIVGAFVNNLPVRANLSAAGSFAALAKSLHAQAVSLAEHQFLPLMEIHRLSEVPLKWRLFGSLVVFQNYAIDPDALQWGNDLRVEEFTAPVRTNYPLTLVVQPGSSGMKLDLVFENGHFEEAAAGSLMQGLCLLLQRAAENPEAALADLVRDLGITRIPETITTTELRTAPAAPPVTRVQRKIAAVWKQAFGLDDIGIDDNFFDLGGHSLLLVQVHSLLRDELGEGLSVVEVFGNATIRKLAAVIEGEPEVRLSAPARKPSATATKDIAIVGMSGRFPGAETVADYWENLVGKVESILEHSDEELRKQGLDPEAMRAAGDYVQRRGQIPDPDCFDAEFFNMSPREAAVTDPQQRLFLETAWSALEDAGYAPSSYRDRIGVFAGMSNNSFYEQYVQPDTSLREQLGDLLVMMGNEKDYLATRTAYKLDLSGPALNVYTACSTSLVALSEAVFALREGRCEMAVAGAISLTFPQSRGYFHEDGGITSPDGHCRPFDDKAGGTVFSNGMGAVVLKPLEDALAGGDTIHAVVRGVGLNNDGADKVSFTAPSVAGQAGAIREALEQAGVEPNSIGYVEGHGTGTSLGDPIEVEALTRAFRAGTDQRQFCVLGSVKSNIGHLDAAAGMAGLIKTTLALREEMIPATLHFGNANPKLRIEETPFRIHPENQPWKRDPASPRRAGVSAFGVGGTNAHVVLEEAPVRPHSGPSTRSRELLVLSARSNAALVRKRQELADFLEKNTALRLADVAFTLALGREVFAHRVAIPVATVEEAIRALRDESIKASESRHLGLPVSFLFPGQGAQFVGMGKALYDGEPVFRAEVDACAEVLVPLLGRDLREIIFGGTPDAEELLGKTRFTQPALFVVSIALSALWKAHGVSPTSMIGHSVGEYSAACLAGVLSREDALHLIAKRAALVDGQAAGAMLSVRLPEDEVRGLLTPGVEAAALNSPKMTVVAGSFEAIEVLERKLASSDIPHKRLHTSHAFHSAMMDPVVEPFRAEVAKVRFSEPALPYVSNVTGRWITAEETASPGYWSNHVRQAVRFAEGIATLTGDRAALLLEAGPGRSCVTFARQSISSPADHPVLATLPKATSENEFPATLGKLWIAGGRIDWTAYFAGEDRRRVSLPTYPFERKRHWPQGLSLKLPVQARGLEQAVSATPLADAPIGTPAAELAVDAPVVSRLENLLRELSVEVQDLTGLDLGEIDPAASFLDLGLDSLLIGRAAVRLSRRFGTKITFRHLMDEHDSVEALAAYLDETLPEGKFAAVPPSAPLPAVPVAEESGDDLASRLARIESTLGQLVPGTLPVASNGAGKARYHAGELHQGRASPVTFGPFRAVSEAPEQGLTARQEEHLNQLIRDYVSFTPGSKAAIQNHRAQLADPRAAAGFSHLWKEMVYPVVTVRSEGAYLWDVDGNRWIDVTHGFGLGLFGHRPRFLVDALAAQLETGFEIGPSTPLAGEVAAMICKVSGKDRATFCNTGSEAVTAAIRVARTVSMRDKIAVFHGSYHGIFDEVLGRPLVKNGELVTAPIAPGIPAEHLDNVLVLEYDNPESLKFIERHADDLAAVLVEPVQSRRPGLQPREFLHALRRVTAKHDIALVFDEVLTGFRTHPRGAQGVFDIDADLVTYGKVLGGGIPIGALAGRDYYMDALDGGTWRFGDDSGPEASVTFFAGTFVRHPLALVAARAVIQELEKGEGRLQADLDARTAAMVDELNAFCEERGVPVKITRFSSMYYINIAPELKHAALLFFHMRLRGIHIWETRPSFLSLVHTEEDIEDIKRAFRESVHALQDGGFFPGGESGEPFPLTPEQAELFLASQMDPDKSRAFNESISIMFEGPLDKEALVVAIQNLVKRHESLRTVFEEDGSGQRVVSMKEFPLFIAQADMRETPEELVAYRDGITGAPFDLLEGPLARFALIRTGEEAHELVLSSHHSVCDGWSFGVLYEDLIALYKVQKGLLAEAGAAAPFRIYVDSRSTAEARAEIKEDTAFWAQTLTPPPPSLALPCDRVGEAGSMASAGLTRDLSRDLCVQITNYCKARRITPYVFFFAAYREVLTRLSQQEDFCIGTPVAEQGNSGLPGLCGHGVHFLPVRCRRSEASTVEEYLEENRGLILESLDHRQSTLSLILGEMAGPRMEPVTATFTLEEFSPEFDLAGTRVRLQVNPKNASTFDISMLAVERAGQFSLTTNYALDKFSAERLGNWLDLLLAWIAEVVSVPADTRPDRLLRGAPAEAPGNPPSRDIVTLFQEQVRRTPHNIALRRDGVELSYAQVNNFANQLALRLQALGVKPGDRVALALERSMELIVTILATLKCGAAYVPIDPNYPVERKSLLLEQVRPGVVIGRATMDELVRDLDFVNVFPDPNVAPGPDDVAYVMFTSGSTGQPKGVMVPHRGVVRLVVDQDYVGISPEDVFLLSAPVSFDASTLEIWGPLLNGGCLAIPPQGILTVAEIGACLERYMVTVLWLTSGLFQLMVEENIAALARLRVLLAGGDVLSPQHVAKAMKMLPGTQLINGYGPTENTTFTTCHPVVTADLARPSIPIGKPVAGTTVYLLDESGTPVADGLEGELFAGGLGVALGYLNDAELTAERFVPDPFSGEPGALLYRTGDRCRRLPDGSLEFLGRTDHQIKIRGFRIELAEIERAIEGHESVSRCRVLVHGEGADGKSLVACCIGDATRKDELATVLRSTLPDHLLPSRIEYFAAFPLSPNGKLDTSALLARVEAIGVPAEESVAKMLPETATQKQLHALWAELLGHENFGIRETFFEVGGHSLLGLRLFNRLQREMNFVRPLAVLFEHPTIESLAALIDQAVDSETVTEAPPAGGFPEHLAKLRSAGTGSPVFLVHGGDGGTVFYRALTEKLGPLDSPVYAIESPALTDPLLQVPTLDKLTSDYMGMIRAVQPNGPYRLGGYSFGGVVAFELARRFKNAGEEVKLVIFDSSNPATERAGMLSPVGRGLAGLRMHRGQSPVRRAGKVATRLVSGVKSKKDHLHRLRRCEQCWNEKRLDNLEDRLFFLNELHTRLLSDFEPQGQLASALLVRSIVPNDVCELPWDYGWTDELIRHLTIAEVPNAHLDLFKPESVEAMRQAVIDYLAD